MVLLCSLLLILATPTHEHHYTAVSNSILGTEVGILTPASSKVPATMETVPATTEAVTTTMKDMSTTETMTAVEA
jgi:hypothetical protein